MQDFIDELKQNKQIVHWQTIEAKQAKNGSNSRTQLMKNFLRALEAKRHRQDLHPPKLRRMKRLKMEKTLLP